jgi:hypothetical protein
MSKMTPTLPHLQLLDHLQRSGCRWIGNFEAVDVHTGLNPKAPSITEQRLWTLVVAYTLRI